MKVKMKVNEKREDGCKDNTQKKKCDAFQNYATPNKIRRHKEQSTQQRKEHSFFFF